MTVQNRYEELLTKLVRDRGVRGRILAVEQFAWMLFLKILDNSKVRSAIGKKTKQGIIRKKFRWSSWACPKLKNGRPDPSRTMEGDELIQFVNHELFPYLREISTLVTTRSELNPQTQIYQIWNVFSFYRNRVESGDTLREVLNFIDSIDFRSVAELLQFSNAFETEFVRISKSPGQANKHFTPRPLVRAIVNVISPEVGDTIYDGAAGTCGFLIESFKQLMANKDNLTESQRNFINKKTFFGLERSPAVYLFGLLNSFLHGIEAPNLKRNNVLMLDNRKYSRLEKHDIVFATIPFNEEVKEEFQQNFEIRHSTIEVPYLQHIMRSLKPNGKAAVVVPDFMLKGIDNSYFQLRLKLLKEFDLHTIISLPSEMFLPYSNIKSSVLFFDRKGKTRNVWYYELCPSKLVKSKDQITDQDFEEFIELFQSRATTAHSWTVPVSQYEGDFSLISRNPHRMRKIEKLAQIYNDKELLKIKETAIESFAYTYEFLTAYLDEWFAEIKTHKYIEELVEVTQGVQLPEDVKLLSGFVGNFPYLTESDILEYGRISLLNVKYVAKKSLKQVNIEPISKDDLIICTEGKVGVTGTIHEAVDGGILSEDLAKLSVRNRRKLNQKFLYLYTLTSDFKFQVRLSTQFENGKKAILMDRFKKTKIPICSIKKQIELLNSVWNVATSILAEEIAVNSQTRGAVEKLLALTENLPNLAMKRK